MRNHVCFFNICFSEGEEEEDEDGEEDFDEEEDDEEDEEEVEGDDDDDEVSGEDEVKWKNKISLVGRTVLMLFWTFFFYSKEEDFGQDGEVEDEDDDEDEDEEGMQLCKS